MSNNNGDNNKNKNKDQGAKNESKAAILSKQKVKAKDVKAGTELIMPVVVKVTSSGEYGSELPFNTNLYLIEGEVTLPGTGKSHYVHIVCGHNDEYLYVTLPSLPWRKRWPKLARWVRIISGKWR